MAPITTMIMMALVMALLLLTCGSEADPLRVFATLDIDVTSEVGGDTMETRTVRLLEGDDASVVAERVLPQHRARGRRWMHERHPRKPEAAVRAARREKQTL